MYGGRYPQTKFTLDAKKMQKSKRKSCGYYWRIIFFFSSLIQSLIIVSLVLFMVYGHPEQSSEEKRVQDLQQSFMQLTAENKILLQVKGNLTRQLNSTLTKKIKDDQDLQKLRRLANVSSITIASFSAKLYTCEVEKKNIQRSTATNSGCTNNPLSTNPSSSGRVVQLQAMYRLQEANFTQIVSRLTRELDGANQARDSLALEAIGLRRNSTDLQRQLEAYGKKCKDDFVQSLSGIQTVTRAFMTRIDSLFPTVFPFQLTCDKQSEQLGHIRANCSSLSREVETKFQDYLDRVGMQVTLIQAQSSRLQVHNARLQEDLRWCAQNRSAEAALGRRRSEEAQRRHDGEVERLLKEQKRLRNDNELQRHTVAVKTSEITVLTNQALTLNASLRNCVPRPSPPKLPGQYGLQYPIPGSAGAGLNFPVLTKPVMPVPGVGGGVLNFPSLTKPGVGGTWVNGPGVNVPGTGSSFQMDVQKHLKELQEMANKASGVSG